MVIFVCCANYSKMVRWFLQKNHHRQRPQFKMQQAKVYLDNSELSLCSTHKHDKE